MADDKYANAKWRFLLRNENQRIWHSKLSGSTPAAAYTASGKIFAAGGYQTGVGKRHLVLGKTGYSHRTKPDLQDKHTEFHQDHAGANPAGSQTGGLSAPEIRKTRKSAAGNQFLTAVFQVSAG